MHLRSISLCTDLPLAFQTISLSDPGKGTQSIFQARTSFAKRFNATFALPGPRDIPEDAFVPHLICPTSDDDSGDTFLDPNEKLESMGADRQGNVKIFFEIDKELKADIVPRCSFILGSKIVLLEQEKHQLHKDLASAQLRLSFLEAEVVRMQGPGGKVYRKKKKLKMKGGRNGKNSPEPPGVADNTTDGHSAMVKILQVALIHEKRARKMDLEDERKERKKEMERMEAQHAKELAAWDEERAALDSKLQELYALNREAFTGDDQDAHDRLTRCVLLDFGRDYIRERVYDSPKTTQRKRWDAFTKRFRSMDHFVAETFLLCQQRGSSLSKDALKRIWQPWSNMRRAGNDVAHGSATTRAHFEHAIATLPKNSTDQNTLTEIFVCKFGCPPVV